MTRNRNHLAVSFALFEYLSQSLAPAVEVFERHLFRLDCAGALGSAENEEVLMAYAKLLWRHSEGGKGWRPGQLRELLERAIKQFPNNAAFLKLFYSNERTSWESLAHGARLTRLDSQDKDPEPSSSHARGDGAPREPGHESGMALCDLCRAAPRRSSAERLGRTKPVRSSGRESKACLASLVQVRKR